MQANLPSVRTVLGVVLFALYLISAVGVDFAHQVFHHHATEITHTQEDELDPCHRVLFHHDAVKDCDHDTHITQEEKCKCIHLAFQQQLISVNETIADIPVYPVSVVVSYQFSVTEATYLVAYLRGPPVA